MPKRVPLVPLVALAAAFLLGACDRSSGTQAPAGSAAASASSVVSPPAPAATAAPAPSRRQTAFDALLDELDERIAGIERRAKVRADDWVHFEMLAKAYLERARLSGDYADYKKAEQAVEEAMRRSPANGGPRLTRATLNYAVHCLPRIEEDLRVIDGFAVVDKAERAAVQTLRANVAFHSGRYAEARAGYEKDLAGGRSPSALAAMAQYLWKTGDLAGASTLLEEAEKTARGGSVATRAWISLVRGLLALDRHELDEALVHYKRGLGFMPGYWLLEEHVAEVLAKKGELDEALTMYLDLIGRTKSPEFMDAAADIYAEKGDAEAAKKWRDEARRGHDERIRLFPEAAAGHALDHYLEHDPPRAVELAEKNRDARPSGEAATKLAQAYLAVKRVPDAKRVVEAALATAWRTAELHATASLVFAAAGDAERARAERSRAEALSKAAMDDVAFLAPRSP